MAKKLKGTKGCGKQPVKRVTGYLRCKPNTAGRRKTTAERRKKACQRGGTKIGVSQHRRKVCHSTRK